MNLITITHAVTHGLNTKYEIRESGQFDIILYYFGARPTNKNSTGKKILHKEKKCHLHKK